MGGQCDLCSKKAQFGNNVSFSQRHTRRRWNVNVQQVTIRQGGRTVRVRVCTRCLRTLNKA